MRIIYSRAYFCCFCNKRGNVEEYFPILRKNRLFYGLIDSEISAMLECFDGAVRDFHSGQAVFRRGDAIENIAILLKGRLHIQREDYWGNRSIINEIAEGDMFGESYAVMNAGAIASDVVAAEDSTVLFLRMADIIAPCGKCCACHSTVIVNLISVLSMKNRMLVRKIGYLSERTTREKLLSYLSDESIRYNNSSFDIPFSRQQLADFLAVDRSAMSKELCRMRDEGLLSFRKNHFELKRGFSFKDIDV